MSETLSVVVPVYNEQTLIRDTLDGLTRQSQEPGRIIVVDNDSTDDTAEIVSSEYPNVTLLQESVKGTGFAANHGFQYAIEEAGATVVMRTDGDTVPDLHWVEAASAYFNEKPSKQLTTGPVKPLKDSYYRKRDEIILPLAYAGYRVGVSVLKGSLYPARVARGANMAIRADTFVEVDGFPDVKIEDEDDDILLTKRVYDELGFGALGHTREMVVRTSMRRIRTVGYMGLLNYYLNFTSKPNAEVRNRMSGGDVDIR